MTNRATFFRFSGILTVGAATLLLSLGTGCRREAYSDQPPIHLNPNMDQQEKFLAQSENDFFADRSAMRQPVPGTVAQGWLRADGEGELTVAQSSTGMLVSSDDAQVAGATLPTTVVATIPESGRVGFYTGKVSEAEDADWVKTSPLPHTLKLLERGQNRYAIYCTPCHSPLGDGNGVVVQRGMLRPASYHDARIIAMADGQIFDIITNGVNNRNMPSYRHQIPVADRWAIVGYIRALQRSQNAAAEDVPTNERQQLDKQP